MKRCGYCENPLADDRRPDALYCDGLCRRAAWAERTGYRAGNGRERLRRPHPGGLQISYRKLVEALSETFERADVERLLLPLVPERQRERLR